MLLFGLVRRLLVLVLVAALLAAGWLFRDDLRERWQAWRGAPPAAEPSLELAEEAQARLSELAEGERTRVALSGVQLQSLLTYHYGSALPAFVDSPQVALSDGRLRLSARVPVAQIPDLPRLGDAVTLLPDTSNVELVAQIVPLERGVIALAVDELTVSRIPVPARMVPSLLERIGRRPLPGLPEDAIGVRLPSGASSAYIRGDSLIVLREAGGGGG